MIASSEDSKHALRLEARAHDVDWVQHRLRGATSGGAGDQPVREAHLLPPSQRLLLACVRAEPPHDLAERGDVVALVVHPVGQQRAGHLPPEQEGLSVGGQQ